MLRRNLYVCFFGIITLCACLEAEEAHKTICLNMIVKNESKVITRCLTSVKPFIDHWVIVDTGSTDGTQDIIKEFMKDMPGELHERPWVHFEQNRNEALALAKGKADYVLFIDADEVLAFAPDFKKPEFDKDFYYIYTEYSGLRYCRVQLINNKLDWKWTGVLHETVGCDQAKSRAILEGVTNVVRTDGCRSQDPRKFQKDAEVLETALKTDPNNSRYVFYLAQSYRDAGEYAASLKNYEKRITMGGWDQEVFWSMLQVGILQEALDMPADTVASSYFKAFLYRPVRAEPLYRIANYYRKNGNNLLAYRIASMGMSIPVPDDILFVEHWIYDYGLLLEHSICTYWLGKYEDSLAGCNKLLGMSDLPENVRECVERNLVWVNSKIAGTKPKDDHSRVAHAAAVSVTK